MGADRQPSLTGHIDVTPDASHSRGRSHQNSASHDGNQDGVDPFWWTAGLSGFCRVVDVFFEGYWADHAEP
jgi:hypothetical protein